MRALMTRVGSCGLAPRRDYFATLCDSIIAQQLSAKAAAVIFDRFADLYTSRRPTLFLNGYERWVGHLYT